MNALTDLRSYGLHNRPGPHCTGCGERLSPSDETMCDDCAAKDAIPHDEKLAELYHVIGRRIDQLRVIMFDHTTPDNSRLAAKHAESTARAILADVVAIDRESRS